MLNLASTAYDYWKKVYKWTKKQGKQQCLGVEDEQARLTDNFYRQRIVVSGEGMRREGRGRGQQGVMQGGAGDGAEQRGGGRSRSRR